MWKTTCKNLVNFRIFPTNLMINFAPNWMITLIVLTLIAYPTSSRDLNDSLTSRHDLEEILSRRNEQHLRQEKNNDSSTLQRKNTSCRMTQNTTILDEPKVDFLKHNVAEKTVIITLFTIVLISGVIGNCLVIIVYSGKRCKRFVKFEKLMLLLGVFDLIASVTNPLLNIYQMVNNYQRWDFGSVGCKIFYGIAPMSSTVSLGILLIMSIDRDRAVTTPFKNQFT